MNPLTHSKISVKNRGGEVNDYYPIHSFIDSTKELCSDNRHRILHNLWGIRRVIIPIFGYSIKNSIGKEISVKDICEKDHILPDYRQRFIPNLADFVDEFKDLSSSEKKEINRVHSNWSYEPDVQNLLLSPLNVTGQLKALRITHSQWFLNEILPQIHNTTLNVLNPSSLAIFEGMKFKDWMDNGISSPKSAIKHNDEVYS